MAGSGTRDVTFHSGGGFKLAGRVYLPDPAKDLKAGFVFCHGFGGVKEGVPVGLSTLMAADGWTVLTFDYRGFGQSEGPRFVLNPAEQAEDAVYALEFLAAWSGIDAGKIAIYGTSFGAGAAALAARLSPRPKAVATAVGVLSGSDWLANIVPWAALMEKREAALRSISRRVVSGEIEMVDRADIMVPDPATAAVYTEKVPMAMESLFHVGNHEPMRIAEELTIPALLIGVEDDSLVPFAQTMRFYQKVRTEKRLERIATGNHWAVYNEALPRVHEVTSKWFSQHVL